MGNVVPTSTIVPECSDNGSSKIVARLVKPRVLDEIGKPVPGIESHTWHGEPPRETDDLSRDETLFVKSPNETILVPELESGFMDVAPVVIDSKVTLRTIERKLRSQNPILHSRKHIYYT